MSAEAPVPKRKLPIAKLVVVAAVLLALAALALRGVDLVAWKERGMALIQRAGPGVFFSAMAVLPAIGAPMSVFAVTGGLVFRESLGVPLTLLLGFAAFLSNIALGYWLARRWLRPLLTGWLARFGYNLPQVQPADMTDFIVLLRVTPGPPFCVQNFLLGLARAPFGRYLVLSCATQGVLVLGFMVFGEALNQGRGKLILFAVLLIAALSVGVHLVRKHMTKKKATA